MDINDVIALVAETKDTDGPESQEPLAGACETLGKMIEKLTACFPHIRNRSYEPDLGEAVSMLIEALDGAEKAKAQLDGAVAKLEDVHTAMQ
jgi:hypothetical protein